MPSQFILSLMELLVNNLAYSSLNREIHNKLTRNMKCLYTPQVNLSLYNKGVYYMGIKKKAFNSLPNWIDDWVQNKKIFIGKLKMYYWNMHFIQ